MVFKIPQLVDNVANIMKLQKGDLILTGTPKGVGPIQHGQTLNGFLFDGLTGQEISNFTFVATTKQIK